MFSYHKDNLTAAVTCDILLEGVYVMLLRCSLLSSYLLSSSLLLPLSSFSSLHSSLFIFLISPFPLLSKHRSLLPPVCYLTTFKLFQNKIYPSIHLFSVPSYQHSGHRANENVFHQITKAISCLLLSVRDSNAASTSSITFNKNNQR